jgi:uncharacterized membrane protein
MNNISFVEFFLDFLLLDLMIFFATSSMFKKYKKNTKTRLKILPVLTREHYSKVFVK